MNPFRTAAPAVSAILALAVLGPASLTPAAMAGLDVHLGTFRNEYPITGGIEYTGDWAEHIDSWRVNGPGVHTVIEVDLAAILASFEGMGIAGFRIVDSGQNDYGSSPGADIDLLKVIGACMPGLSWTYEGPNSTHGGESSAGLQQRIAQLDAVGGDQDHLVPHFVSLGQSGVLEGSFASVWKGHAGRLRFSEAGREETFDVFLTLAPIPAPPTLALLAAAGFGGRRRRRA